MKTLKFTYLLCGFLAAQTGFACPPYEPDETAKKVRSVDDVDIIKLEQIENFAIIQISGDLWRNYKLVTPGCDQLIAVDGEPFFSPDHQYFIAAETGETEDAHLEVYQVKQFACPEKVYESKHPFYFFEKFEWISNTEFKFNASNKSDETQAILKLINNKWILEGVEK